MSTEPRVVPREHVLVGHGPGSGDVVHKEIINRGGEKVLPAVVDAMSNVGPFGDLRVTVAKPRERRGSCARDACDLCIAPVRFAESDPMDGAYCPIEVGAQML